MPDACWQSVNEGNRQTESGIDLLAYLGVIALESGEQVVGVGPSLRRKQLDIINLLFFLRSRYGDKSKSNLVLSSSHSFKYLAGSGLIESA